MAGASRRNLVPFYRIGAEGRRPTGGSECGFKASE
jgi:hypothetical protein